MLVSYAAMEESTLKPKRTRKKAVVEEVKAVVLEAPEPVIKNNEPVDQCDDNDEDSSVITSKKTIRKSRKPKAIYSSIDPLAHIASDDENIIMKLTVSNSIATEDQNAIAYHPNDDDASSTIPDAYNMSHCDAFDTKPVEIDGRSEIDIDSFYQTDRMPYDDPQQVIATGLRVIHLLKDFEEKNKNNEWPSNTSISCYWCCHQFTNAPYGIPVKYTGGKFHVYGCFCSLECAAAYNIASKESIDEVWERHNLINLLARKVGQRNNFVRPAPNRLALRMFGGHLSIEEFRRYAHTNKIININFPPMMTMTQQIEEINESDINNDYKYIPIDTERINKYKEKIKLRRTKPLHDNKNTLDHAMNLKFA